MQKKYVVFSLFDKVIDGRFVWLQATEGYFDSEKDALERIAQMREEEKRNADDLFFEIKELYSNKY